MALLAGIGLGWGWVAFGVPLLAAVGVALLARRGPLSSAVIAAVAGFVIVVGYAVAFYAISGPEDRASDPNCDGFCFTREEGWLFLLLIASFVGFWVALASGLLAAVLTFGMKRRAVASR
jgi:hypothetical protein